MEGEIVVSSTSVERVVGVQQLVDEFQDLPIQDQTKNDEKCTVEVQEVNQGGCGSNNANISDHHGVCAVCLNKIVLQETALVKGCEHAYCVTCILRWASYKKEPTCPQCKHPFDFLNVHRSLDGSLHDFMIEESVCLLLRAPWYKPLVITEHEAPEEDIEDYYYYYEEEDDDLDEVYLGSSSNIRIGNRRWGDNGYVRAGRQEARPIHHRPALQDSVAGPSRQAKKKEPVAKELVGRRAKRALKREAADKAAAEKHQQHLARFGRLT